MKKQIEKICEIICENENITYEQLIGRSRKRKLLESRYIFVHLIKLKFDTIILDEIGIMLGFRNYSTIINIIKQKNNLISTSKSFALKIKEYELELNVND